MAYKVHKIRNLDDLKNVELNSSISLFAKNANEPNINLIYSGTLIGRKRDEKNKSTNIRIINIINHDGRKVVERTYDLIDHFKEGFESEGIFKEQIFNPTTYPRNERSYDWFSS